MQMRASLRVKPLLYWLLKCWLVLFFMASAYAISHYSGKFCPQKKRGLNPYPRSRPS